MRPGTGEIEGVSKATSSRDEPLPKHVSGLGNVAVTGDRKMVSAEGIEPSTC
jgi:hypothetical protein